MMSTYEVTHDGTQWSNANEDRVRISAYDPQWPGLYDREARLIRGALCKDIQFEIEHFGSTAIAGLAAKPIIDIMLVVPDQEKWPRLIAPLEGLQYIYWADNPRTDRMFFVKGMPPYGERRTHHVHVRTRSDAADALLFRDFLRRHPKQARRYERLKWELSKVYPADRETYTEGKAAFVADVLGLARREQSA